MDFSQFDLTDPFVRRALAETLAEDNGLDYQDEYIRKALNDEIAAAAAPKPIDGERNLFGDTVSRLARGGVQLADTAIHAVDTAVGGSETLQGWSDSLDKAKQNVGLLRPDKSEHEEGWLKRSYGQALESAPMSAVPWAGAMAGAKAGAALGTTVFPGVGTAAGTVTGGLIGGAVSMAGLFFLGTYGQRKEEIERELTATRPDLTPDQISKMAHDNALHHGNAETWGETAGDLASWAILSKVPGGQAIFKGGKAVLAELVKPNAFKAIALGVGKSMPFEVGSEVGTAIWQNEADKAIGVEQGTSTDAALAAIGPALFLSAGMGVAVGGYSANQRRVQYNALNSEDQQARAQAVDQVAGTLAEATDQQTAKKWRDMAIGFVQNGQPIPLDINLAELSANEPEVAAPEAQDQPAETILKAESVDEAIQEAEAEIAKPGWLAPTAPDLEESAWLQQGVAAKAYNQGRNELGATPASRAGLLGQAMEPMQVAAPADPLTEVLTTISTADQPTLLQMADGLPGLVEGSPELAPYQRQLSEAITERQRTLWEESNVGRGKVPGDSGTPQFQPEQPAGIRDVEPIRGDSGRQGDGESGEDGSGATEESQLLTAARQHVAETGGMTTGGLAMALDVDIDTAEKLLEQVKATTPLPRNIGGTQAATVGADTGGFLTDQAIRKTGATSPATTAGGAQGFISDQGIRKAAGAVTAAPVADTEGFVRDQQLRRDAMGRGPKPTRAADEPARAFLARKREWEASVSQTGENETQAELPRTDETQAGDQGGGQGEYDYDLSSAWRGRAPQVAAPTVLKSTTGGKEYAIPGLEELRVTVKPPSGNKAKHTKLGWSVYVGNNLIWANLPGVADTAENAINSARGKLKRIHAAIAKDQAHTTPKTTSTSDLPGVGTGTAPSPGEASNIKATAGGENGETLRRGEEGTADYGTTTNGAGGQKNTARGGAAGPGRAADVDQPQREQWELTAAEWEKAHARDRRLEREAIEKVDRLKRQPRPKSVSANLRYLEKISAAEKVLREASENADRWGGEAVRKEVVRRAYESGKPVPSVILAEFPELSPPAAQPSASKATPEKPAGVATSGQRLPADYDPASDEERFYGSKVTIKEQRARNGKVFRKETTGRVDRVLKGSSGGNVFEVVPDGYEDAFRYDEGDIVIDELVDNKADKKDEVAPVKSGRPSPGQFVPASKEYNSTAQGQKDMSARGSRIAMLKGLNRAVGKVYTDGEIESAADENIDAIRDYLIERQRQEQAAGAKPRKDADMADVAETDFGNMEQPAQPAQAEADTYSSIERELQRSAHKGRKDGDIEAPLNWPGSDGSMEYYVSMADAVAAARKFVAAGGRPVPFQVHNGIGVSLGDADTIIAALDSPAQAEAASGELEAETETATESPTRLHTVSGYPSDNATKKHMLEAIAEARKELPEPSPKDGFSNAERIDWPKPTTEKSRKIYRLAGNFKLVVDPTGYARLIEDMGSSGKDGSKIPDKVHGKPIGNLAEAKLWAEYYLLGKTAPSGPPHVFRGKNKEYEYTIPNSAYALDNFEKKVKGSSGVKFSERTGPTLESIKAKYAGRIDTIFVHERNDGDIHLASVIVGKGNRQQGIGSEFMADLVAYADANGKRIVLSPGQPDDRHGTTSRARLVRFYKRFGFIENRGRNKDYQISEGMYRVPAPKYSTALPPSARADIPGELTQAFGKLRARVLMRKITVLESQDEAKALVARLGGKLSAAWHGSPHEFDEFRMSAVGTGEGAQVYGHGLYFASKRGVAEHYKTVLSAKRKQVRIKGVETRFQGNFSYSDMLVKRLLEGEDFETARERIVRIAEADLADLEKYGAQESEADWNSDDAAGYSEDYAVLTDELEELRALSKDDVEVENPAGRLYKVELAPQEDEYLLWDLPLSEQSEKVRKALEKKFSLPSFNEDFRTAGEFYKARERKFGGKADASKELHSLGVRGIKYLDGSSRSKGEGAYNYVIFDEKDIEITVKYSKDGAIQGIYANGKTYLVADGIAKNQAVPVLLHELGEHAAQLGFAGDREYQGILRSLEKRAEAQNATGKAIRAAMDRVPEDTLPEHYWSEVAAYLVENKANGEIGIVKRILHFFKKWLYKAGAINADRLTPEDLVLFARSATLAHTGATYGEGVRQSVREMFKLVDTESAAFLRWFGDSKVVDADGKPLVVYHGTPMAGFDALDIDKAGTNIDSGYMGRGVYLTNSASAASYYANTGGMESPGVYPLYVSMNNPFKFGKKTQGIRGLVFRGEPLPGDLTESVIKRSGVVFDIEKAKDGFYFDNQDWFLEGDLSAALTEELKSRGFDGVISEDENGYKEIVAFRPEQVKSALSNTGDFSPADPRIRYSKRFEADEADERNPLSWDAPLDSKKDTFLYNAQNKFIDLFRVQDAIQKHGGTIDETNDVRLAEELYHKRSSKRVDDFLVNEAKPLMTELAAVSKDEKEFERFLWARHAREANESLRLRNPTADELREMKREALQRRNALAELDTVKAFLAKEREIAAARHDVETGEADDSLLMVLNQEMNEVKADPIVQEYERARARHEGLKKVQPFEGDNTWLSGMKTDEADEFLRALPADRRAVYTDIARKWDTLIQRTRETLVEYELEDQETIDSWANAFQHYVPLNREDMDGGKGIGQGFSVKGSSTKGRVGSYRAVSNILANIVLQRERAIVRGEKAAISRALHGLATANPNKDFWSIEIPPTERTVDPVTGMVINKADMGFKSRPNVVVNRFINDNGKIEERAVVFNDQNKRALRMAEALKNLDTADLGAILGVSAKITRFFSAMNTQYNVVFGPVNLVRDAQAAVLNLSTTPIKDKKAAVVRRIAGIIPSLYKAVRAENAGRPLQTEIAKAWREMQLEGGTTGFRDMFADSNERAERLRADILQIKQGKSKRAIFALRQWVSDYNDILENSTRLAVYMEARESGISKKRAAQLAKDVTLNFNRKGQVATQAGAMYAFFNAAAQGTEKMYRTMTGPAGKKILTGGLLLGAAQTMLLAAAGFDEDEPPEFIRERNLIIPIGWKKYITVPMPLGFHVIPNLTRVPTEWALRGFKEPGKAVTEIAAIFAEAFNPLGNADFSMQTFAPTPMDPFIALGENKDWTGRPIAKQDFNTLKPTPGHTRARDTASWPSEMVSRALNLLTGGNEYVPGMLSPTPDQIDYLVGQAAGGVGREAGKLLNVGRAAARGESSPAYRIPFVGRFYGNSGDMSGVASRYYTNLKRVNRIALELDGIRENGGNVAKFIRSNPEARTIRYTEATYRNIQKLQRAKRRMLEGNASRSRVEAIDRRIIETMRRFNERTNPNI